MSFKIKQHLKARWDCSCTISPVSEFLHDSSIPSTALPSSPYPPLMSVSLLFPVVPHSHESHDPQIETWRTRHTFVKYYFKGTNSYFRYTCLLAYCWLRFLSLGSRKDTKRQFCLKSSVCRKRYDTETRFLTRCILFKTIIQGLIHIISRKKGKSHC